MTKPSARNNFSKKTKRGEENPPEKSMRYTQFISALSDAYKEAIMTYGSMKDSEKELIHIDVMYNEKGEPSALHFRTDPQNKRITDTVNKFCVEMIYIQNDEDEENYDECLRSEFTQLHTNGKSFMITAKSPWAYIHFLNILSSKFEGFSNIDTYTNQNTNSKKENGKIPQTIPDHALYIMESSPFLSFEHARGEAQRIIERGRNNFFNFSIALLENLLLTARTSHLKIPGLLSMERYH